MEPLGAGRAPARRNETVVAAHVETYRRLLEGTLASNPHHF
jgi:hypothetical protein